jgi:hypothetical protein
MNINVFRSKGFKLKERVLIREESLKPAILLLKPVSDCGAANGIF